MAYIENIEKLPEEKTDIVVSDNYPESIPDYAIRRFAKFLLPLMQADFEDEESAHLYSQEKPL